MKMRHCNLWIAGRETVSHGEERIERRSPAGGEALATFALGTAQDVADAVAAARKAFDHGPFRDMSGIARAELLRRLADLMEAEQASLAAIEAEEAGKPIRSALAEVEGAIELTRFAASLAYNTPGRLMTDSGPDKLGMVLYQPRGVVGMILPWNYPLVCLMQKLPFALAAGCAVVIKPSEYTSSTTLRIAALATEAAFPDGQVNVVTGNGAQVGEALATHPGVDMISFTGSSAVGKRIARNAADGIRKVALELGGKGANIVFADADLDAAVEGAFQAFVIMQGQECCAGSRLLVEAGVAAEFEARLAARCREAVIGFPLEDETELGPLIHEAQLERVLAYIQSGKDAGARLVTGGRHLTEGRFAPGCFLEPTIFADVNPDMAIVREEIFGPVLSIIPFTTAEEAIAIANDTPYGLANGVWTRDLSKAMLVMRRLRCGMTYINTYLETIPQLPFGGVKESGLGRENGAEGMLEFMDVRAAFAKLETSF